MKKKTYKNQQIVYWLLYDFANTSYSLMITTLTFAMYYKMIVVPNAEYGDFFWGLIVSISMAIVAIISPMLGAIADYSSRKKRFLRIFTLMSVLFTGLLFFATERNFLLSSIFFILSNIGFQSGLVFYNSFLPQLTPPKTRGKVSGQGFAAGYFGALVSIGIAFPFLKGGFEAENRINIRISFLVCALFFLIFAAPALLWLREPKQKNIPKWELAKIGWHRIRFTFKEIRNQFQNLFRFLLSFFVFKDGIETVIVFSSIYAAGTLNMPPHRIVFFFLIVQSTAIIGSLLFGWVTDRIGAKRSLMITLVIWIFVVVGAFLCQTEVQFYVIGLLAGIAMGSSQSSSRCLLIELSPQEKQAEFFGFYSFCGKTSAILGPILFGTLSRFLGQRIAVLSLLLFFGFGIYFLEKVRSS